MSVAKRLMCGFVCSVIFLLSLSAADLQERTYQLERSMNDIMGTEELEPKLDEDVSYWDYEQQKRIKLPINIYTDLCEAAYDIGIKEGYDFFSSDECFYAHGCQIFSKENTIAANIASWSSFKYKDRGLDKCPYKGRKRQAKEAK